MHEGQTDRKTGGKVPSANSRKSNQGSPENESKELGPQSALLLFLPVQCPFLLLTAPVSFRVPLPWIQYWWNCHYSCSALPWPKLRGQSNPFSQNFEQHRLLLETFPPLGQLPLFCAPRLAAVRTLVCPCSQPCTVPGTWYSIHVS